MKKPPKRTHRVHYRAFGRGYLIMKSSVANSSGRPSLCAKFERASDITRSAAAAISLTGPSGTDTHIVIDRSALSELRMEKVKLAPALLRCAVAGVFARRARIMARPRW